MSDPKKPLSVVFYEKPGCVNNKRQAIKLVQAGVVVDRKNLLDAVFTPEHLKQFFSGLPKEQWINPTAPAIKSGKIVPLALADRELLVAMCQDPLLIRRPLMVYEEQKWAGFDWQRVCEKLGIECEEEKEDLETCVKERDKS